MRTTSGGMSTLRRVMIACLLLDCPAQQFGKRLAVGLLQLLVEHAPVFDGQIDARLVRVAGDLPQAARSGLQHEVVAALQFARQRAGEQGRHVPAFHAAVYQQGHPLRRVLRLEAVEIGLVVVLGVVFQQQGRRQSHPGQRAFDDRAQFGHIIGLREEDRQLGGCAVRQADIPVGFEEIFDDEAQVLFLVALEIDPVDVARHFLQDAIANAFGQPIPDDHIPQGLALVEGRAGRVDHAHQLRLVFGVFFRAFGMRVAQVIDRLADFLQVLVHRLAVGVVGFIAENG